MQNVWLDTLSNWKSKMTRKPRECRSLSLRKWLSSRIEAFAKGRRELRLASSPSLSFSLSLSIFGDIEVSAGTNSLWDMSSRTVVEADVVHCHRRRRRRENKICQITEPAGGMRTLLREQTMTVGRILQLEFSLVLPFRKRSTASESACADRLIVCCSKRI